jgi:hypothetical protein
LANPFYLLMVILFAMSFQAESSALRVRAVGANTLRSLLANQYFKNILRNLSETLKSHLILWS